MPSLHTRQRAILFNQDSRCHYCRREMIWVTRLDKRYLNGKELAFKGLACTRDHVIPVGEGGGNHIGNLVGACYQCNAGRGTIGYELFKRYVRRFGPPKFVNVLASSKKVRRAKIIVARQRMRANGLSEHTVNDIMKAKLLAAGLAENVSLQGVL